MLLAQPAVEQVCTQRQKTKTWKIKKDKSTVTSFSSGSSVKMLRRRAGEGERREGEDRGRSFRRGEELIGPRRIIQVYLHKQVTGKDTRSSFRCSYIPLKWIYTDLFTVTYHHHFDYNASLAQLSAKASNMQEELVQLNQNCLLTTQKVCFICKRTK